MDSKTIRITDKVWLRLKELQLEAIREGLPSTMSDVIERLLPPDDEAENQTREKGTRSL